MLIYSHEIKEDPKPAMVSSLHSYKIEKFSYHITMIIQLSITPN